MKLANAFALLLGSVAATSAWAAPVAFDFDRPSEGFSTSTTPVGRVAWEQSLPNYRYDEQVVNGTRLKTEVFSADTLLRSGLTDSLELQLGFAGPAWRSVKGGAIDQHDSGLGDVSVGLKKAIDLKDDKLSWAVLGEAIIATGNDEFTNQDDIYRVGSALSYQYNDILQTEMTMRYAAQNSNWAFSAIPSINYAIAGKWSGYSELVYTKPESLPVQYSLGSGVMYRFNDRTQADFSVASDLSADRPSYRADLGFGFLF